MFWKRELFTTSSLRQKEDILQLLSSHGIPYRLKTEDNFGGGLYEQRRMSGSFGMDASCRFIYHIWVSKKDYEAAEALLQNLPVQHG